MHLEFSCSGVPSLQVLRIRLTNQRAPLRRNKAKAVFSPREHTTTDYRKRLLTQDGSEQCKNNNNIKKGKKIVEEAVTAS